MPEIAHAAIDAGADVVIGHGPHYSLPVEAYRGKPIFYGLGSFSFHTGHGGRRHGDWIGMMAEVTVDRGGVSGAGFRFVRHNDANATVFCPPTAEAATLDRIDRARRGIWNPGRGARRCCPARAFLIEGWRRDGRGALMVVSVRQLHPLFAGEVSGVDIGRPLDAATVAALNAAIDRYAVLVFRGQELDDERQMAFALNFGELEIPRSGRRRRSSGGCGPRSPTSRTSTRTSRCAAATIRGGSTSSATGCGTPTARSGGCRRRCRCSMRTACRSPGPKGKGETEFADMRAAYDALPRRRRRRSTGSSRCTTSPGRAAQLGFTELLFGEKNVLPPVPQRLVRTHPGSKRKVLYVAAHACEIVGWPMPEGRLLLRELIEHATVSASSSTATNGARATS